jgi:hypothetical protein
MTARATNLTPELAAQLLAKLHPRQRKISSNVVQKYARAMRLGKWNVEAAAYDPIIVDKTTGALVNGGHRCAAVVASRTTIPVYIDWEGNAEVFDFIDIGRKRDAAQFIRSKNATLRASATRVVLWHELLFDQPMGAVKEFWQMSEVLEEAERLSPYFDRLATSAAQVHDRTGLARGVVLGAMTLAAMQGREDDILAFVKQVTEPAGLLTSDPAYVLVTRMGRVVHRKRLRQPLEDWTIFVRCLNAHLTGDPLPAKLQVTTLWPKVGESEKAFLRRNGNYTQGTTARERWSGSFRAATDVPLDKVLAAVLSDPGLTFAALAKQLKVSDVTARGYARALGDRIVARREGPTRITRLYPR